MQTHETGDMMISLKLTTALKPIRYRSMPIKVRCQGCDKTLVAPDQAQGKGIKCPQCGTVVKVPSANAETAKPHQEKPIPTTKSVGKQGKAKTPAPDSEVSLLKLDLNALEDKSARICPRCGYDMSVLDEEITECPQCGHDIVTGGLGARARRRLSGAPDSEKFFKQLWTPMWRFVGKNQLLAWRTIAYVTIASALMFGSLILYLQIAPWPPRLFFALCAVVSGLMIPGWLWFLDQEVIAHTLMRKEKMKRINFDFFLCSALGLKSVAWHVAFAGPLLLIPAGLSGVLVQYANVPGYVAAIIVGVCYLLVLSMLPIVMGHMVMPVQLPGWMFWKVIPAWARVWNAALTWLLLLLLTHAPALGCLGATAGLYGPQLVTWAQVVDHNSAIARAKFLDEAKSSKDPTKGKDPLLQESPTPVNYQILIIPGVLWFCACLCLGFPALYIMRLNAQLVFVYRDWLDLVVLEKETKYVAKISREEEDAEAKPKTWQQALGESAAIAGICVLIGGVFGMIAGNLTNLGTGSGIFMGVVGGSAFALLIGHLMLANTAFQRSVGWGGLCLLVPFANLYYASKFWEEARAPLFTWILGLISTALSLGVGLALGLGSNLGFATGAHGATPPPMDAQPPTIQAPQIPGQNLPGAEVLPPQ
ncbi:MAG: hypothetical protein KatS3mg113_0962 [Planctomycetaceae bacterium]|nr:MAG: hypothetical protein KatS3mg113_0962 [Planctomycetaceae bacterium]